MTGGVTSAGWQVTVFGPYVQLCREFPESNYDQARDFYTDCLVRYTEEIVQMKHINKL